MLLVRLCRCRPVFRQIPTFLRAYATTEQAYIPPAQLEDVAPPTYRNNPNSWRRKDKPASPAYYTTRPSFYETIATLNDALQAARLALRDRGLYPLPAHALAALPEYPTLYMNQVDMAATLADGQRLTTTRHRRVIDILSDLHECRRIARAAALADLERGLDGVIEVFERPNKEARLAQGKRKPVAFDEYGRSYTVGRRKESSARVWLIPTVPFEQQVSGAPSGLAEEGKESVNDLPVTQILVNNTPLPQYFPHLSDREAILRPFKVAGVLGAYNVFALVRGGGTTGQTGSIVTGIARGILAQEHRRAQLISEHIQTNYLEPINRELAGVDPALVERMETMGLDMTMSMADLEQMNERAGDSEEGRVMSLVRARREKLEAVRRAREAAEKVELVLRRSKLVRRDPRMVERKKTGLAKARKRYAWVKR